METLDLHMQATQLAGHTLHMRPTKRRKVQPVRIELDGVNRKAKEEGMCVVYLSIGKKVK